jgi:hypothetical protein
MWRRYDQMHRFPAGLLVFGDAIASFNPSYGQGMTMAALQALALKDCFAGGETDRARRFFAAAAAQPLGMVWQANRITGEFAAASRNGPSGRAPSPLRQAQRRLTAWWMDQIMTAVGNDIAIAETLFRARNFTAPPTRLQAPMFHARVVVANLRRRRTCLSTSRRRRPGLRRNAVSWAISRQCAWDAMGYENMQRGMRLYKAIVGSHRRRHFASR